MQPFFKHNPPTQTNLPLINSEKWSNIKITGDNKEEDTVNENINFIIQYESKSALWDATSNMYSDKNDRKVAVKRLNASLNIGGKFYRPSRHKYAYKSTIIHTNACDKDNY